MWGFVALRPVLLYETGDLLSSLPPAWDAGQPRKLLNIPSAMERLTWIEDVRDNVDRLADFLLSDPPANDVTRRIRKSMEQELGVQLALYAAETWARTVVLSML